MVELGPNGYPIVCDIEIVPIAVLPDRLRSVFPYDFFNAMQSKCFPSVYNTTDNFVLSAPTGSGKTAVLEIAICNFMVHASSSNVQQAKIIYQAPTKALCSERRRDWSQKFGCLGLNCEELTGDSDQAQLRHVQNADIIITTPEKWDSVTRKWHDHRRLMKLVRLFLIDEVHILKEDRGASLEAVVSRMKSVGHDVRFVALSATIPNSDDIAAWLGRNSSSPHLPAIREVFGEKFRPVLIEKHVLGLQSNAQNEFQFEQICNNRLSAASAIVCIWRVCAKLTSEPSLVDVITKYTHGKSIMIFCFTRTSTEATAKALAHLWKLSSAGEKLWHATDSAPKLQDPNLAGCSYL